PSWTVAQVKSALESTGDPVHPVGSAAEIATTREGGGRIDLSRADDPLLFTAPTGLSFGLVKPGVTPTQQLTVTDAGGGAAPWAAAIAVQSGVHGATLTLSAPTVAAGATLGVTLTISADAAE